MDTVANWLSFQRVQTEAWKIEVLQIVRRFQSVQYVGASLDQSGIDLRAMSGFVQFLESLMPEAFDHAHNVMAGASCVKYDVTPQQEMQRYWK